MGRPKRERREEKQQRLEEEIRAELAGSHMSTRDLPPDPADIRYRPIDSPRALVVLRYALLELGPRPPRLLLGQMSSPHGLLVDRAALYRGRQASAGWNPLVQVSRERLVRGLDGDHLVIEAAIEGGSEMLIQDDGHLWATSKQPSQRLDPLAEAVEQVWGALTEQGRAVLGRTVQRRFDYEQAAADLNEHQVPTRSGTAWTGRLVNREVSKAYETIEEHRVYQALRTGRLSDGPAFSEGGAEAKDILAEKEP